jgi:membrane protease YdiL (CAAX protease family)
MSRKSQHSICIAVALWILAVILVGVYGARHGYTGRASVISFCILALFLAIQLGLAAGNLGERLARRAGPQRGVLIGVIPFVSYLIYLAGVNGFTWRRAGLAAAYTLAPVVIALIAGTSKPGAWPDYLAMMAIFLPLKLRWLIVLWPSTNPQLAYILTMLLAVSIALATFLFVRQFDGVGYNIVWGRDAVFAILINFGLLAVILIPLGTALHFIKFDPSQMHWKGLLFDATSIFLLTAWPEELLFRGLLQNSLAHTFNSQNRGWLFASVLFGFAHINNNGVFPNWKYVLLAVIAGMFYGRAWRRADSIFPAAIVHALVDTLWHVAFRTL